MNGLESHRLAAVAPPLAIMTVIFLLSSRSHVPTVGNNPDVNAILAHLVAYGALSVAIFLALESTGRITSRSALLAITLAMLFGVTDEIHQYFVPGRHADPFDLVADGAGALILLYLFLTVRRHLTGSIGRRMLPQTRRRT